MWTELKKWFKGQRTHADTVVCLLSTSHCPHRLTQQEWTAGNHGDNCSSHSIPRNGQFLLLSHDVLGVEDYTGSLKYTQMYSSHLSKRLTQNKNMDIIWIMERGRKRCLYFLSSPKREANILHCTHNLESDFA